MRVTAVRTFGAHATHCGWLVALALAMAAAPAPATAPAPAAPQTMPPPRLVPQTIDMGAFYNGARVHIDGTAPSGAGVLIAIEGSERDEFFNRKGRVGPIWLTVDRIHVKHAPSVFLRFSSAHLGSMLDEQDIQKYELNEAAIMSRIQVLSHCKCSLTNRALQSGVHDTVPDASYAGVLYADFLKLKEHEGTYYEKAKTVHVVPAGPGVQYALEFDWPKQVPPGTYRVSVYACRGGRVIARSAATLQLAEVGFPAYMAKMASAKPWIYGIVAVLAAILAGFLTDLFTSRLQRRRRSKVASNTPAPDSAHPERPGETSETAMTHKD